MERRRLGLRILGLSPTHRGFAFAVLEGPKSLIDWGVHRLPAKKASIETKVEAVLGRSRPYIIALEDIRDTQRRDRGRLFFKTVRELGRRRDVVVVPTTISELALSLLGSELVTKHDVAGAVASRFREIARRLPGPSPDISTTP